MEHGSEFRKSCAPQTLLSLLSLIHGIKVPTELLLLLDCFCLHIHYLGRSRLQWLPIMNIAGKGKVSPDWKQGREQLRQG